MSRTRKTIPEPIEVHDEPGMAERFQRGLRNLINTPPKPRLSVLNRKGSPHQKGRLNKGKANN